MPVSVQPPIKLLTTWLLNLNGSSHSQEATNAWRRSQSERPRSALILNGSATVAPRLSVELLSIDFESVYDPTTLRPPENLLVTCAWKLWYQLRKSLPRRKPIGPRIPGSKITRSFRFCREAGAPVTGSG